VGADLFESAGLGQLSKTIRARRSGEVKMGPRRETKKRRRGVTAQQGGKRREAKRKSTGTTIEGKRGISTTISGNEKGKSTGPACSRPVTMVKKNICQGSLREAEWAKTGKTGKKSNHKKRQL